MGVKLTKEESAKRAKFYKRHYKGIFYKRKNIYIKSLCDLPEGVHYEDANIKKGASTHLLAVKGDDIITLSDVFSLVIQRYEDIYKVNIGEHVRLSKRHRSYKLKKSKEVPLFFKPKFIKLFLYYYYKSVIGDVIANKFKYYIKGLGFITNKPFTWYSLDREEYLKDLRESKINKTHIYQNLYYTVPYLRSTLHIEFDKKIDPIIKRYHFSFNKKLVNQVEGMKKPSFDILKRLTKGL